jgi:pyrroloquinoline quinone (PQQ) biosynthesis protein C
MEHFHNPFDACELAGEKVRKNRDFLEEVLSYSKAHRFYSHPFLLGGERAELPRDVAISVLTSFYQLVRPFTGFLCCLAGRAPSLRTRMVIMDNIYEEMGCGELGAAHPALYLRMLGSLGVSEQAAERMPTVPAIERINRHLRCVVEQGPFCIACAVLATAELVIPPVFRALADIAQTAFEGVDMAFFDRHGIRDEGHAGDALLLFAVSAEETHFAAARSDVMLDLDYRCELNDAWLETIRGIDSTGHAGA